jgi:hypothetical protein
MIQLNVATLDLVAAGPPSALFERLTQGLRPAVKILAQQMAASETSLAALAFLRCTRIRRLPPVTWAGRSTGRSPRSRPRWPGGSPPG